MSDMGGQPPAPILPEDPARAMNALVIALRRAAEDSAGAQDPREVKELAQASLAFAQAITILDPTRLQGGDTPQARVAATPPQVPSVKDGDTDGQVNES